MGLDKTVWLANQIFTAFPQEVTGLLTEYRGKPQIIIHAPDRITIKSDSYLTVHNQEIYAEELREH